MRETPNPEGHYAEPGQYTFGPRMIAPPPAAKPAAELTPTEPAPAADNDPDTTDNDPDTTARKHPDLRLTSPVLIHISKPVHILLKRMARRSGQPMGHEASEAITYWVLYLSKIARKEANEKNAAEIEHEMEQAEALLYDMRMSKYISALKDRKNSVKEFALLSRKSWARRYPGKPWPGVKITNQISAGGK